jgi:ABC-type transport system involved in cytochrome c biogenesis permease component
MNQARHDEARRELGTRLWDLVVDRNPVLAKELFVTARTPIYVGSILLAPVVLAAIIFLAWGDTVGPGHRWVGRELFPFYFTGLSVVLGTIGAALGSTVIVQERERGALEALKFSSLRPSSVAVGKFAAVVLAQAVLALCTLPLLGLLWLLGGVGWAETAIAMGIAMAVGTSAAGIGVAVSAHVSDARRSLLLSLLASSFVGIAFVVWLVVASDFGRWGGPFAGAVGYTQAPFDGKYLALLCLVPTYGMTALLWLSHAAATSGLMDPSEDRGLPIKRWTAFVLASGAITLDVCTRVASSRDVESLTASSMIAVAALGIALLFVFAGEPAWPTRRMLGHAPSRLGGLLFPRCLGPSVVFVIISTGLFLVSVPIRLGATRTFSLYSLWVIGYLSTFGGLMGAVAVRRGKLRARITGVVALLAPLLFVAVFRQTDGPTWIDEVCPLWLAAQAGSPAERILSQSVVLWAALGAVSLAAMFGFVRASARRASP